MLRETENSFISFARSFLINAEKDEILNCWLQKKNQKHFSALMITSVNNYFFNAKDYYYVNITRK